jgi:hypothetical protein
MIGPRSISIWFFIGIVLSIYGVTIFIANVSDYFWPSPEHKVILWDLHFGIWWGLLLMIIGATYLKFFRPSKKG